MAGLTGPDRQDFVKYLREAVESGWEVTLPIAKGKHAEVRLCREGDVPDVVFFGDNLDEAIEKFVDGWPSRALASA
jgi:hypothetical protein